MNLHRCKYCSNKDNSIGVFECDLYCAVENEAHRWRFIGVTVQYRFCEDLEVAQQDLHVCDVTVQYCFGQIIYRFILIVVCGYSPPNGHKTDERKGKVSSRRRHPGWSWVSALRWTPVSRNNLYPLMWCGPLFDIAYSDWSCRINLNVWNDRPRANVSPPWNEGRLTR